MKCMEKCYNAVLNKRCFCVSDLTYLCLHRLWCVHRLTHNRTNENHWLKTAAFETRSLVTGQHSRIVVPSVYSCATVLFIVVEQNPWKVIWSRASCISHLLIAGLNAEPIAPERCDRAFNELPLDWSYSDVCCWPVGVFFVALVRVFQFTSSSHPVHMPVLEISITKKTSQLNPPTHTHTPRDLSTF